MIFGVGSNQLRTFVLPFDRFDKVEVALVGEGAQAHILGYFVGRNKTDFELDLVVRHQAPRTKARTLVRGVLTDAASCRFRGLIKIEPEAHLSDSFLSDHTLLLSGNAHSESIPSLEIKANDVKASHAATVGKIDRNQLYYLRTRGVPEEEARRLVVTGFFRPILDGMTHSSEKSRLLQRIKHV